MAQLVTKVCLPTYMIVNLTVNFSHDQLIEMSGGLPVPIISMALGYFIGHAAARLLKVRRDRVGVFCTVLFCFQFFLFFNVHFYIACGVHFFLTTSFIELSSVILLF